MLPDADPLRRGRLATRRERGFPAWTRLKRQSDFDVVFKEGRKVVVDSLVAWMRPAVSGQQHSRLGLAVGKRSGGAVARNRIKRLLRDAFRHLAPSLPAPMDMVLVPRPATPMLRAVDAHHALGQVFARHARGPGPPRGRRRPRR